MLLQTALAFNPTTLCIEDWKSKNVYCQNGADPLCFTPSLHSYTSLLQNTSIEQVSVHKFSLITDKENQCENPSNLLEVPMVVRVYRAARTYFQSQSD